MHTIEALAKLRFNTRPAEVVAATYDRSVDNDYVQGKVELYQRDLLRWYCDLDTNNMVRFERIVERYRLSQEAYRLAPDTQHPIRWSSTREELEAWCEERMGRPFGEPGDTLEEAWGSVRYVLGRTT